MFELDYWFDNKKCVWELRVEVDECLKLTKVILRCFFIPLESYTGTFLSAKKHYTKNN